MSHGGPVVSGIPSLCITRSDLPVSAARAQCPSQGNALNSLSRRVKHFRWDPRHLSLQPNTYHDFNRKCWRCHHTHPISRGPGLPGTRFTWSHLLDFGTYIDLSEKQLEMVGQGRRFTSHMIVQTAKSVSKNRYKHNHRRSIEGKANFVTLFISYMWEGAEPCRFSTIS